MKAFMDQDFILSNETAKILYHDYAKKMPIFDFHNHLSAKEIYEDGCYENLAQVWLGGDHYKWRAMRTYGIDESLITNQDADSYEKFLAWAETVENAIANPLYHWTHLELQRYFEITEPLTTDSAKNIWEICNEKLQTKEYSVRNLLKMQNVKALCTTDDPCDDLEYHKKLQQENFEIQVLPTFRPDKAISMEKSDFVSYIEVLSKTSECAVDNLDGLEQALRIRLDYFQSVGCLVSDHSLEGNLYEVADKAEVEEIFARRMKEETVTGSDCAKYRGYILGFLGREYHRRDMVMQLHIGALRNNSSRLFTQLGENTGFDCMNDFNYAEEISKILDAMDVTDELPKTVLYYLNPKDTAMLACMIGNFQGSGVKGKVQLGSAWWFNDHKHGMEEHFELLGSLGLVSTFIGMLTDSRSYLSFPRHEYFRRIICNKIGCLVEDGEYPADIERLGKLVENISYKNAEQYFGLK